MSEEGDEVNNTEELHELDIFQLRDRVFDLEKQNKRLRRQLGKSRDKLALVRADLERVRAARRVVRLQLVTQPGTTNSPIVSRMVSIRPGTAESVQLQAHVRPENPVLNGYFIMTNIMVSVIE